MVTPQWNNEERSKRCMIITWSVASCWIDFPPTRPGCAFSLHGINCIMWPIHWSVQLIHDPSCQREGPSIPQSSPQLHRCQLPRLNVEPALDCSLLLARHVFRLNYLWHPPLGDRCFGKPTRFSKFWWGDFNQIICPNRVLQVHVSPMARDPEWLTPSTSTGQTWGPQKKQWRGYGSFTMALNFGIGYLVVMMDENL